MNKTASVRGRRNISGFRATIFPKNVPSMTSKRADVCSSYRCQLLKDFADGKVTLNDALEIVREARNIRTELIDQYQKDLR